MKRAAAALAAVMLVACRSDPGEAKSKPDLYVLTSLPLLFDEGFGIGPAKGEAAVFLRDNYTLKPIDLPSQLPKGAVLLAAQPRALPAEELVVLDAWVRAGGRMALVADPMLEWPSNRPPGDKLRPPMAYPDTGLLAHWGLRLDAPDQRGRRHVPSEAADMDFLSPGTIVKVGGQCEVDSGGIGALCKLGRGEVRVIADADWVNFEGVRAVGGQSQGNLAVFKMLLADLAAPLR